MDAALDQLKNDNFPVNEEDEVRLSPFAKAHFNMLGRYSFSMPDEVKDGKLRSLSCHSRLLTNIPCAAPLRDEVGILANLNLQLPCSI